MNDQQVIVAVSIGNTSTSAGIYVDGSLVRTTRIPSAKLREHWRLFGHAADDWRGNVTAIVLGSVVPKLTEAAKEIASSEFDAPVKIYRTELPVGIKVDVDAPDAVGQDRLSAAFAAWRRFGTACVIVDFGTAITVDAVSDEGAFVGGAILPGVRVWADALAERTALLPRINLSGPDSVPGRNTVDAIRGGILRGAAGAVDRLVKDTLARLGPGAKVIATGGDARLIVPLAESFSEIEPSLALEGLVLAMQEEIGRAAA